MIPSLRPVRSSAITISPVHWCGNDQCALALDSSGHCAAAHFQPSAEYVEIPRLIRQRDYLVDVGRVEIEPVAGAEDVLVRPDLDPDAAPQHVNELLALVRQVVFLDLALAHPKHERLHA